jgi:sulfoxide reductase heme-binding subunit YedZ
MLHRLIYGTAIAGVTHYWWLVKADVRRPETYAVIVGTLLAFRIYWARSRAVSQTHRASPQKDGSHGIAAEWRSNRR